ncbi:MAG: KpsF/GutQ family sugar-phosphate isomerase [Legionellales bacterium]|nr:KpsF/GutQ family sugar-phosphate isomerase [Legionellales bacterium]
MNFCHSGLTVIEVEARALTRLTSRIDQSFAQACQHLLTCEGRIVVIGMGKSGHIGHKIAATLASTGSPAFFVHPAEACHGDMGMITNKDAVLAISNSGNTEEINIILPLIKRLAIPLISLTGNPKSTLAAHATVNLDVSVDQEACPLGLAPTASTTAALAMGDALAIAMLEARGFTAEDFALAHPGGSLGRRLLLRVEDVMHTGDRIPTAYPTTSLSQTLLEVTQKKLGMTCIVDQNQQLQGIFTDGDLRRALDRNIDIHTTTVGEVMTVGGKTISPNMLAAEALSIIEQHQITALIVTDPQQHVLGVIHLHDLIQAQVV